MSTVVNTGKLAGRRPVRLENLDELLVEIDQIEAAEQAGTLRQLGNWTPGQVLGHLAAWINYNYEGYPGKPPPWFVRWILRLMLTRFLQRGLPAGQNIPGAPGGTYGIEPRSTADGAEQLRRAVRRLQSDEPAPYDSPAFGPLTHPQRIQLNLRHAELHLSFLQY